MLTIHHLGNSRSERIVWLAEELGLAYKLVRHERDPQTMRSPPSLWAVSPMGKSPVIEDSGITVAESGAVVEYLLARHGGDRLRPDAQSMAFPAYLHWLHAAESTLMTPVLMRLLTGMAQVDSPFFQSFIDGELETLFKYMDTTLGAQPWIAGTEFTAADIMVSYPLFMAGMMAAPPGKPQTGVENYPNLSAYIERLRARPAYQRAIGKCGG